MPFAAGLDPWVDDGLARLERARPGVLAHRFTTGGYESLRESLRLSLIGVAGPTLFDAFNEHPARTRFVAASDHAHRQFVDHLRRGGAGELTADLTALGAAVDRTIGRWADAVARVDEQLLVDRSPLAQIGAPGGDDRLAVIAMDTPGCIVFATADGRRGVHKTRDMTMDAAWATALDDLASGAGVPIRTAPVLVRDGWGWMGHIPHDPCPGGELSPFGRQFGVILALAHALGGGDLHAGNVRIAAGHPVVIDAEVLLRPGSSSDRDGADSLLRTGLLPTAAQFDVCGLVAGHFEGLVDKWLDLGTDAIRPAPTMPRVLARRREIGRWLAEHRDVLVPSISSGLADAQRWIAERGVALPAFDDARPRVLLRTTRTYADMLRAVSQPDAIRNAAHGRAQIAAFIDDAPRLVQKAPHLGDAIAQVERAALADHRIPRFTTRARTLDLWAGEALLGTPFDETPLERAARMTAALIATPPADLGDLVAATFDESIEASRAEGAA